MTFVFLQLACNVLRDLEHISRLKFYFDGKELNDGMATLGSLEIPDGATLHYQVRLTPLPCFDFLVPAFSQCDAARRLVMCMMRISIGRSVLLMDQNSDLRTLHCTPDHERGPTEAVPIQNYRKVRFSYFSFAVVYLLEPAP